MKKFLISGANRGLGFAYTSELLSQGHTVLASARKSSDQSQLEQLQESAPDQLKIYRSNLASEAEVDALIEEISQDVEGIDCLINNAGILTDHETIETVQMEDLLQNFFVNAAVPVILAKASLPLLRQSAVTAYRKHLVFVCFDPA